MADLVTTVEQLRDLPQGTIIRSTDACANPNRYAGKRFQKWHDYALRPLDPDKWLGLNYSANLSTFKDPLPAEVIGFEEVRYANTDDLLGENND